ncbi:VRR-NUC domain-containing protein [Pavlovales sp. CCMP2436]|nr:VRR-NUC domain-containing protein [Pavlovales sp. CCMP2436]
MADVSAWVPLPPAPSAPPEMVLRARPLPLKEGSRPGGKLRYAAVQDDGGPVGVGVEELVLQVHASQAGWRGFHCETGAFSALFGLLLWAQIYDESVPDVFVTTCQSAPRDFGTDAFWSARAPSLESRLSEIARTPAAELGAEVQAALALRHGIRCVGVSWARWGLPPHARAAFGPQLLPQLPAAADSLPSLEPLLLMAPREMVEMAEGGIQREGEREGEREREREREVTREREQLSELTEGKGEGEGGGGGEGEGEGEQLSDLAEMAACLGGKALAAILRVLAEDYRNWSSGMPDLVLWRALGGPSAAQPDRPFGVAKVVEVKSPSDKLSEQQRQWLDLLLGMGVTAEVYRVAAPVEDGGEEAESDSVIPPEQLALVRSSRASVEPASAVSPGRAALTGRAIAKPKRTDSATPRAPKQQRRISEAPTVRMDDGDRRRRSKVDAATTPIPIALGTDDDFQQPPRTTPALPAGAASTAKRGKLKGQSLPAAA